MNDGKICVSVCAGTADKMIEKIKRAEPLADVIEVRFDCLDPSELDICRSEFSNLQSSRPLLATFRCPEQGGRISLSQSERVGFWLKPQTTFWAADVEEDIFDTAAGWPNRIVSSHDVGGVPSDFIRICERLLSYDDCIAKIAVRADDITDSILVWKLIERAKADEKSLIPIAIGEAGKWTRILGLAHGAYMTYASLGEGDETADGQITARDLIEVYRVKELDKDTEVYGVIGDPVSSSLSPYMQNAAFAANKINAVFLPLLVSDLGGFIRRMVMPATREVELNFAGFSVTMPHKRTIIKHLDEIDAIAAKIGAVNTVKIESGKLIGFNTDAPGFITPLKARFGDLKGSRVAIFGAGGAARACVYALAQERADVTVFARDKAKAELLANEFKVAVDHLTTDKLPLAADIVVNATPLGMKGIDEDTSPLTASQLEGVKFVYDLVTRSVDTPIVCEAKKVGIPAIGGLEMLIAQGMKQFEIWAGQPAPEQVMRRTVIDRLTK